MNWCTAVRREASAGSRRGGWSWLGTVCWSKERRRAGDGLDRQTIRAMLNGKRVKVSTLAKVVIGLRQGKLPVRIHASLAHHQA